MNAVKYPEIRKEFSAMQLVSAEGDTARDKDPSKADARNPIDLRDNSGRNVLEYDIEFQYHHEPARVGRCRLFMNYELAGAGRTSFPPVRE